MNINDPLGFFSFFYTKRTKFEKQLRAAILKSGLGRYFDLTKTKKENNYRK